jgi:Zn-dependent protease
LCSAFFAASVHELCHIAALYLCNTSIHCIRIDLGGATIVTAPLPPLQELLCAAAGPLGSFLCLLTVRKFPLFAFCGLIQGMYNLLPLYPMDGGRVLRCLAELCFPNHGDRLCRILARITQIMIFTVTLLLAAATGKLLFLLLGLGICAKRVPSEK